MGERCSEVCTIDRTVSIRFRAVDVFASWTVEFHCFLIGDVGETDREESLRVAVDAGAAAEICFTVFFELSLG